MATTQIQRYLLLTLAAVGLLSLAYLLRTGWLQTVTSELDARASLGAFRKFLEQSSDREVRAYFTWFHYLLMFTLGASFLQVLLSLLKPVRNPVLLTIDWGILLSASSAILFFWLFGLRPGPPDIGAWLLAVAAAACCALAMHAFARAFIAYPSPMTPERVALYQRRYLKASAELTASKHTRLGRWRRAMLAWQMRKGRTLRLVWMLPKVKARDLDLTSGTAQLLMLHVFPCATFASFCAFWAGRIFLGDDAKWVAGLAPLPILFMVYAWGLTVNKIVMDYRLGDAIVRKQVLWLLIGAGFPLYLGGGFGLGFALPLIAPSLFHYAMLFMFLYFPVLAYLLFVLCLMISIFFYGAIDPERVLKVGALYSFLGLVLTVLFSVVEQLLGPLLLNLIGLDGMEGAVVSATIVALSFRPLRGRIETGVERGLHKLLRGEAPAGTSPPAPRADISQ